MEYTLFQKIQIWFIKAIAGIRWKQTREITLAEQDIIRDMCTKDYYIIATRKSNYLTTFFITLGHFFLTGKWGYYSHVLMNLEDEVEKDTDFRFMEATGKGTHYSTFADVFNTVDSVALIKPKNMTVDEWTVALDKAKVYLGRPYDNLFNVKNDLEINCVELIRLAMMGVEGYDNKFPEFEKMLAKKKKLTPDMFIECPDFVVVFCIRK